MNDQTKRVLVTGGTGDLGRALVPRLQNAGYTVRITSRRSAPADREPSIEWAQVNLVTGKGMDQAMAGVGTVIHAASSPFKDTYEVDVEGTRRLLVTAEKAAVAHFLYISIVGIDRIPYKYYQSKLAAEKVIEESRGVPWSILRATQFHNLADMVLQGLAKLPIILFPLSDFQFQLIDTGEVAGRLVESVQAGPGQHLPDIGGPKVQRGRELAQAWLKARKMRRLIVPLPLFGQVAAGFRQGLNTVPENPYGRITWSEWLQQKYSSGKPVEN